MHLLWYTPLCKGVSTLMWKRRSREEKLKRTILHENYVFVNFIQSTWMKRTIAQKSKTSMIYCGQIFILLVLHDQCEPIWFIYWRLIAPSTTQDDLEHFYHDCHSHSLCHQNETELIQKHTSDSHSLPLEHIYLFIYWRRILLIAPSTAQRHLEHFHHDCHSHSPCHQNETGLIQITHIRQSILSAPSLFIEGL